MELIRRQLHSILEREGLSTIDSVGQLFDPRQHEATARHPAEDETGEDTVVEELQPGYRLHDEVLRPAMVKVARRKPAAQGVVEDVTVEERSESPR
jgi:molecular chaperone GrpE